MNFDLIFCVALGSLKELTVLDLDCSINTLTHPFSYSVTSANWRNWIWNVILLPSFTFYSFNKISNTCPKLPTIAKRKATVVCSGLLIYPPPRKSSVINTLNFIN